MPPSREACRCCGQPLPPQVPAPVDLGWRDHWYIERRVVVAMMLDHLRGHLGRGEFAEWTQLELADHAQLRYRQVSNALKRLVRSRWVDRVRRGRYRLTVDAVAAMRGVVQAGGRLRNYDPVPSARQRVRREKTGTGP